MSNLIERLQTELKQANADLYAAYGIGAENALKLSKYIQRSEKLEAELKQAIRRWMMSEPHVTVLREIHDNPDSFSPYVVASWCGKAADKLERLEGALRSIAANTCCGDCQEAKLVALEALSPTQEVDDE